MEHKQLSTVDADDGVSFPCVSLRDETWAEATKILSAAWDEGYRTRLWDDGLLIFKESAQVLSKHGMDCGLGPPETFSDLTLLLEDCSTWWEI